MRASLVTAGERLGIESDLSWVDDLIEESAPGELRRGDAENPSIRVSVESDRRAFDVRGWAVLTRGAWHRAGQVVLRDPCTAGFDLLATIDDGCPSLTFRWRPPRRTRAAAWALRSRFHLLARAVLVQFPALWWAGTRGRAPLHASACTAGGATPLLAGPGGVGKSTLLKWELARGVTCRTAAGRPRSMDASRLRSPTASWWSGAEYGISRSFVGVTPQRQPAGSSRGPIWPASFGASGPSRRRSQPGRALAPPIPPSRRRPPSLPHGCRPWSSFWADGRAGRCRSSYRHRRRRNGYEPDCDQRR